MTKRAHLPFFWCPKTFGIGKTPGLLLCGFGEMGNLKKCATSNCDRFVRSCVLYCCTLCKKGKLREGMKPGYEEIAHSDECWVRHEKIIFGVNRKVEKC